MCEWTGKQNEHAVAVFKENGIHGESIAVNTPHGIKLQTIFTKLPPGKHGFHIHRLGDLRGEGCKKACEHYHNGPPTSHGAEPGRNHRPRHTGDLGNIELDKNIFRKTYFIDGIQCSDLWGRALIVHADEDDLGIGLHSDSMTTGHSGARIGCAIFGRAD